MKQRLSKLALAFGVVGITAAAFVAIAAPPSSAKRLPNYSQIGLKATLLLVKSSQRSRKAGRSRRTARSTPSNSAKASNGTTAWNSPLTT